MAVVPKLEVCSSIMHQWGRSYKLWFTKKISRYKSDLLKLRDKTDSVSVLKYSDIKNQLNRVLELEEDYWRQRSKAFWLSRGDQNSKYFHGCVKARKKANRIYSLRNVNGELHTDVDGMNSIAQTYFEQLFSTSTAISYEIVDVVPNLVSDGFNDILTVPFVIDEFKTAIFQMHSDRSLGPDGLNPGFFQHFWNVIGVEIFNACVGWLSRNEFPASLNDTIIVLIPKCDQPDSMSNLRPISFCNVLYKLIAKVLANRIKIILPEIISESQSAFVLGRALVDNVFIAFESLHYMQKNKKGPSGNVALKLDIRKAYDRVDWGVLRAVMSKGFIISGSIGSCFVSQQFLVL
ncbi:hypothetical protein M5689_024606 [Euphorbia peplus]|nr:hypothetical protein M5689_024606 [Euphorbia peplus]